MKAIILNGALLVLLAGMMVKPALAQSGYGMGHGWGDRGDRLESHVSYLENRLDLTEDQVKEVEVILKDQQAAASEFKKSQRDATRSAIEQVLTDEQKGTFAEMQEKMGRDVHEAMMGRQGYKASRHRMHREAFIEELGLTDEQVEQFDSLRTSHKDAMKGLLTPEQLEKVDERRQDIGSLGSMGKAHGKHRGAGRMMEQLDLSDEQKSQLKTLRNEQCVSMRDGLKSILTDEQLDELQELREEGHWGGRGGNWMGDCWK